VRPSSWRRPRWPATRTRISARLCAGSGSRIASSAASIARRVSSAPAFATRPTVSPEYGEATSIQSPVSIHSPPISSLRSRAVTAMRASLDRRDPTGLLVRGRGEKPLDHAKLVSLVLRDVKVVCIFLNPCIHHQE